MASGITQPEFGQRLRRLRIERDLSQRDLAVGVVNPSYVSLLESGARVPTLEVALQIARALGVPLRELVSDASVIDEPESQRSAGERLVRDLLARSAVDHGDLPAAVERFRHAYQEARDAGRPVAALQYGFALDEILGLQAEHEARYQLDVELADLAAAAGAPELVIKVRIERASAARQIGRLAEAARETEHAHREIEGTAFFQSGQHVRLLSIMISILCDTGSTAEVPTLVDEMLSIADKIVGSRPLSGRAHWTASVAYARIGDQQRAVDHVRHASQILAGPATSLRDWAHFSRSATSALLDAEADLAEIERFLEAARAAVAAAALPSEAPLLASVEVRYALAAGDHERALRLSEQIDEDSLAGFELVRLLIAKGRALHRAGRVPEAVAELRRAARHCDEMAAYQLASSVWREIDQIRGDG
jgi:transcriptional regulator with XRE-family HTH domain